jgi:hypothetical protein
MKAYDLNTSFTFGKYEGKTLEDVFKTDPTYVEKCMITVDDFAVDEKSIQKLFEKYPDTELSDQAVDANLDKLDAMDSSDDEFFTGEEVYSDDDYEDFDELPEDDKEEGDEFGGLDDDDLFGSDSLEEDWDDDDDFR